jgi:hypothetical protein
MPQPGTSRKSGHFGSSGSLISSILPAPRRRPLGFACPLARPRANRSDEMRVNAPFQFYSTSAKTMPIVANVVTVKLNFATTVFKPEADLSYPFLKGGLRLLRDNSALGTDVRKCTSAHHAAEGWRACPCLTLRKKLREPGTVNSALEAFWLALTSRHFAPEVCSCPAATLRSPAASPTGMLAH